MEVRTLGLQPDLVPYAQALEEQRRLHAERVANRIGDQLLLLEHIAVFTAGAQTRAAELPAPPAPVERVDRGGRVTWHGPGQLVGYPIVRLPEPLDVVAHVRRLEQALIDAVAVLGVTAHTIDGRSGVWVERPGNTDAKLAAIGVRVERSVTRHGFALNCSNELTPFEQIVPCGISDAGVTSLSEHTGRTLTPAQVIPTVVAALQHTLSLEKEHAA